MQIKGKKFSFFLPDNITAIKSMIKAPEKRPTLNVIQGESCSPSGGTLSRFIAL